MQLGKHTLKYTAMPIGEARKTLFELSKLATILIPSGELSGFLKQDKLEILPILAGTVRNLFQDEENLRTYESVLAKFKHNCMVCVDSAEAPLTDAMYDNLLQGNVSKELEFMMEAIKFHFSDFLAMMGGVVVTKQNEEDPTTVR